MPQSPNDYTNVDDPFGVEAIIAKARSMTATPPTAPATGPDLQLGLPSNYWRPVNSIAGSDNPAPAASLADYQHVLDRLHSGVDPWPTPQADANSSVQLADNTLNPWGYLLGLPAFGATDGPNLRFGRANDITAQLDARLNQGMKPDPVQRPSEQGVKYLKDTGFFSAPPSFQTKIDPIPGYDETGAFAWRTSNNQVFLDVANAFNGKHGYGPGDPGYRTADMVKAQAMVESGGNQMAFLTDPLQVNNPGDWNSDKLKFTHLTGPAEAMTPEISTAEGLEWLDHKGWESDGKTKSYRGDVRALQKYNANKKVTSGSDGLPHYQWYAQRVIDLANAAAPPQR